jgi:hypothetical protein
VTQQGSPPASSDVLLPTSATPRKKTALRTNKSQPGRSYCHFCGCNQPLLVRCAIGFVVPANLSAEESTVAIPPELEAQILRYYHVEKWRMGTIARQLHVHHGTVKRVLSQAGLTPNGLVLRGSRIDPYLPFIRPEHAFATDERVVVRAGKTPYVRFDLNDYSIPHTHVLRSLTVFADQQSVRITDGSAVLARHARSYDKGAQVEDPRHIEALVRHKGQARKHRGINRLNQAAPASLGLLARVAERGQNLGTVTASLLRLLDRYGAAELQAAIEVALAGSSDPSDRTLFILTQFAFGLLAATDGHAKNFSIFLDRGDTYGMTPLYDILSMWPYVGDEPDKLSWRRAGLAMAVRSKNAHYHLYEIQLRHWHQLAMKNGGPELWNMMVDLAASVEDVLNSVESLLPHDFPQQTWEAISTGMRHESTRFLSGTS